VTRWLAGSVADLLACWLAGLLASLLAGLLAGWLACWLAGWLACKPIHVKIEWISIQNRSDINLK